MIISKAMYNEMLDLINEQRHQIENLQTERIETNLRIIRLTRENQALKNDKHILLNVLRDDPYDIDYPNERGVKGAKTTTIDTNGNIRF